MKRILAIFCLLITLTGCAGSQDMLDRAMALRSKLLAGSAEFHAKITADYSDRLYTFGMDCKLDPGGNLEFTVTEPESIAGIKGSIAATGGKLTFGEDVLAFPLLAEGQISPVSAPWLLMKTLRSGYLTSCGTEDGILRLSIDDSYEDDALHLDIWLNEEELPKHGEILWQGRRILSVAVEGFRFV